MTRPLEWLNQHWHAIRGDATRLVRWARQSGPFYLGSAAAHVVAVIIVLSWAVQNEPVRDRDQPTEVDTEIKEPEVARYIIGTPPVRISELSARSLELTQPPGQIARRFDDSPLFEDAGGGTRRAGDEPALGGLGGLIGSEGGSATAAAELHKGVGIGLGSSNRPGSGGPEEGFNGLGKGERPKFEGPIDEQETERSVAAALNWLRRHQHDDGSWSFNGFAHHCESDTCSGPCDAKDDVLATALGLLAFVASGQTHTSDGPYQRSLVRAVDWLMAHQASDGGFATLSAVDTQTNCVAALSLSEAYALTGDVRAGEAAQRTVQFLEDSPSIGADSWRWAAIVIADRVGLGVHPDAMSKADQWLLARQSRAYRDAPSPMISVVDSMIMPVSELSPVTEPLELFPSEPNNDPTSDEVIDCLVSVPEWPQQQHIRRTLLATQARAGCATGSWPGEEPKNVWTPHLGRLPATCFAAILLAASYRRLPMQKTNAMPLAREIEEIRR